MLTDFRIKGISCITHSAMSYSRILAHYPYVIYGAVIFFATTCIVVVFTIGDQPDFQDPRLGFETRGTDISNRLRSHEKLLDLTRNDRVPVTTHFMGTLHKRLLHRAPDIAGPGQLDLAGEGESEAPVTDARAAYKISDSDWKHDQADPDGDEQSRWPPQGFRNTFGVNGFFCDVPKKEYAHIVFESVDGSSLFTADRLRSMCLIEEEAIASQPAYTDACLQDTNYNCCRSWSLGNYVALLSNRCSCAEIEQNDVAHVLEMLKICSQSYHDAFLKPSCNSSELEAPPSHCSQVPVVCLQRNVAIYHVYHYLADIKFMSKQGREVNTHLSYGVSFLPLAAGIGTREVYEHMEQLPLADELTKVVAIKFGIKQDLFDQYLKADSVWFGAALASVFVFMWLYTASLFLTLMTIICILMSMGIAYFLYTMVFEVELFPFMNLLSIVIIIGVGADDVFICCRVWTLAKLEKNAGTLEKIVSDTLKHAALSMFVTSLTTGAAFYANYVSDITSLRCFAIFSGTVILVNFVLVVTWVPATIVIVEKWCSECCMCYGPDFYSAQKGCSYYALHLPYKAYEKLVDCFRELFEKVLPCLIIKARILWIVLFGSLGLGGLVVVFYYPRLKLPTSNEFQLFAREHPFEVYDLEMKDRFWFEKAVGDGTSYMPMAVVWGVQAIDNGNHLDPTDEGSIVYDTSFDMSSPQSQQYLLKFCRDFRSSPYYKLQPGLQLTNCFIESFIMFMKRGCEGFDGRSLAPCCGTPEFPYSRAVFNRCIKEWLPLLSQTSMLYNVNTNAGLRYSQDNGKMVALIVEYSSNQPFSYNYEEMRDFYNTLEGWVTKKLEDAPPGMANAWFISDLEFYDLQRCLAEGTPLAIGVSLGITCVLAFLTTLNVFITLYAMASISLAIFVTVAALVLLGWQLNILEAFTITVAIGLSIDFTLHYGMAYRLSPDLDREMRVVSATVKMGSPVAMAAFTTILAGALMMPSTVLAYRQIGTFLMLVMTVSWLYATFFFQALLRTVGPQGGFGQFHWPSCDCCSSRDRQHVDKTIYAMSESTLSSSSTNHVNSSDVHELEPLTNHECEVGVAGGGGGNDSGACPNQRGNPQHIPSRLAQLPSTSQVTNSLSSCPDNLSETSEVWACREPDLLEQRRLTSDHGDPSPGLLDVDATDNNLKGSKNSCHDVVWVRQKTEIG